MSPGLSSIFLTFTGQAFDEFSRKELNPGIALQFRFPYTFASVGFNLPIEREAWGSNINRTAEVLRASLWNYFSGGALQLSGQWTNDSNRPDSLGLEIRGYGPLRTTAGGTFTLEYTHPLLKIRKGFWNPNIFFEDLCGAIFTDIAFSREGKYNLSFGMELKLETGLMLGLIKFAPKFGVAVTKDREIGFYLGFE